MATPVHSDNHNSGSNVCPRCLVATDAYDSEEHYWWVCVPCGVRWTDPCLCPQCTEDAEKAEAKDEDVPSHGYTSVSELMSALFDSPTLPTKAAERKRTPIATGVIDYFPDAIVAVAQLSQIGNDQHNPGQPLHWAREKSTDESDALMRHFIERGTFDTDGVRHSAKVAWRALALLQREIEADQ